MRKIVRQDEPILLNPNPYYGRKTTLVFPENPGKLADLEVDMFLDGKRPTLQISGTSSAPGAVKAFVYSDGFIGEGSSTYTTVYIQTKAALNIIIASNNIRHRIFHGKV